MNQREAFESLELKFTSGNSVPVERASITRAEWDAIRPATEQGVGEPVAEMLEKLEHVLKVNRQVMTNTGVVYLEEIYDQLASTKPTGGEVTEGYVKKHKLDQVVEGAKRIEDMQAETIRQLRDDLRTAYLHQEPNETDPVWYWQGDGYDHPESLTSDAVVVIRADQLRALLATQQPPEQESSNANHPG